MDDTKELLWRALEGSVKAHIAYLRLALEVNLFFYAIAGGIASFVLSHDKPWMKWALLFPAVLAILLTIMFVMAAVQAHYMRLMMYGLSAQLGFNSHPEGLILVVFCALSAVGFVCVFAFALWLLIFI